MTDKPCHTVRMAVEILFQGTYYEPREMVDLVDGWFADALDDRSDVRGYRSTGTVTADGRTPTAPLAAGLSHAKGRCPACGGFALYLATGGYLTCAVPTCPAPDAASRALGA